MSDGARLLLRVRLRLAVCSVLVLGLAGCESTRVGVVDRPTDRARLVVSNLSQYDWIVEVRREGGRDEVRFVILPRAVVRVDLTPGRYAIVQSISAAAELAEPVRREQASFEAGGTYRWRLATLHGANGEAEPPPTAGPRQQPR